MLPSVSQSLLYISFCKKRHIVAAILFQILRIPSIKPNIRNRQNFKIVVICLFIMSNNQANIVRKEGRPG